jgi:hypothetical protein
MVEVNTIFYEQGIYNRSFPKIKVHTIMQTPLLHVINIRLQKFTVINISNTKICIFRSSINKTY